MSMLFTLLSSSEDSQYFQGAWSRFFGTFIESGREKAGLSVEQAAELAGMEAERWTALEAGAWLPTTREQCHRIAVALDIDWVTMTKIVLLCRQAWGIQ